jgi:hypothetical protein
MMRSKIFLICIIALLCAQSILCNDKLLHEIKTFHNFSSRIEKDTFILKLTGQNIIDGMITFEIVQSSSKIIYKSEFKAVELIGYDYSEEKRFSKKEYILKRMNEFFNETNFTYPAISKNEKYDSDYSDKKNWEEIKADSSAIGFTFLLGEENSKSIAYSKKIKKVIEYFHCC